MQDKRTFIILIYIKKFILYKNIEMYVYPTLYCTRLQKEGEKSILTDRKFYGKMAS